MNGIKVITANPSHYQAFHDINKEWIDQYFTMEEMDRKMLIDPKTNIIDKGGQIFVALVGEVVAGVVALKKMDDEYFDFELAKMGVKPTFHRRGIAKQLAEVCLAYAKDKGAKRVYLETNSILEPAVKLYHKIGFVDIPPRFTDYCRCDTQMEYIF